MHHRGSREPPSCDPASGQRPSMAEKSRKRGTVQTGVRSSLVLGDDEVREIARRANLVAGNVASVILGKGDVIESCVVALLAGGHVIIEDYPGVGKTLLAKALARSVGGRFSRIQFTPDLLPSDVTGVSVFDQKTSGFEFRPGPIFANFVLADEINRSSPKTQASLLECMEEGQATIDNIAHPIVPPFMILATQNPIEYEGTYPLPEAQLDRFMMRLSLGYPSSDAEAAILDSQTTGDPFVALEPVTSSAEVLAMQKAVLRVEVDPSLRRYVVELLAATRDLQGHLPRRQPSRRDRPPARRQSPSGAARQGLRGAAGPQGPGRPGAEPPHHPLARCRHPSSRRGGGDHPPARGGAGSRTGKMTRPTPRGAALIAIAVGTYVAARILGTWELYVVALAFTAMVGVSWVLVIAGGWPASGLPQRHTERPGRRGPAAPRVPREERLVAPRAADHAAGRHRRAGRRRPVGGSREPREPSGAHRHLGTLAGAARRPPLAGRTRRGGGPTRPGEHTAARRRGAPRHRRAADPGALLVRPLRGLGHAPRWRAAAAAHARRL